MSPIKEHFAIEAANLNMNISEYLCMKLIVLYDERKNRNSLSAGRKSSILSRPKQDRDDVPDPSRPFDTASGYRGVYKYGKRWAVIVSINGKNQRIGTYASAQEAAEAFDRAQISWGYRAVNFPNAMEQFKIDNEHFVRQMMRSDLSKEEQEKLFEEWQAKPTPSEDEIRMVDPTYYSRDPNIPPLKEPKLKSGTVLQNLKSKLEPDN